MVPCLLIIVIIIIFIKEAKAKHIEVMVHNYYFIQLIIKIREK
jgi:hypothetical protein